jgi:flagellar protein FlgJ
MTKLTSNDFINAVLPHVLQVRKEGSLMFPSVRIAQNILETGCVIHSWNNLGGIKVGSGKPNAYWRGGAVNKGTWEVYDGVRDDNVTAAFRAYDTLYDFYKDQDLLFELSRYARVRAAKTPGEQALALQECGYATDPQYPGKLMTIIKAYDLTKYDVTEEDDDLKLTETQWTMLVNSLKQQPIDKSWVEKAEKKTLTLSELTWLNTIALTRK